MRNQSFAQGYDPSLTDRFGVWLSGRQIRRWISSFEGKRVGDIGCGFHASFARTILDQASRIVLVDVAIADDLKSHPKIRAVEGMLPDALRPLETASLDVVMAISVLEHLWEPLVALKEFRRLLAPGGTLVINVPSWRGKFYLEMSAFKLGFSPASEMEDHKMYYDVPGLWPLLVAAGFMPSHIQCFSYKLGLNTFAVCTEPGGRGTESAT